MRSSLLSPLSFGVVVSCAAATGCGGSANSTLPLDRDAGSPGDDKDSGRPGIHTGDAGADSPGDAQKESGDDGATPDAGARPPSGLHVVNGKGGAPGHIVDGSGKVVELHGADRSGTEFACTYGGLFDGPADQPSVDAMKAWNINAVRVPLNEDCWLGINGVPAASGGANYQSAIKTWVDLLTTNGLVVVLDMHWTAPGTDLAQSQAPMADADHTPTAWSQIATTFAGNGSVIFDLFNEPFITDWGCWVQGGMCAETSAGETYEVAGMASLLKAVRGAGAKNVVILGGLSYSSDMSMWASSVASFTSLPAPLDGISIEDVAASWHAYDFNSEQSGCPSQYNGYSSSLTCNSAEVTAMNTSATDVLAAGYPIVLGEVGISACDAMSAMPFSSEQITDIEGWLDGLLTWAEGQGQGYLAWSWNTDTLPILLMDYTGNPSIDFGVTYQAHLSKL